MINGGMMTKLSTGSNNITSFFKNLPRNLASLIHQAGITEAKLAKSLNIPYVTIRRIINGDTTDPHLSTLKLISDYFYVGLDALIGSMLPVYGCGNVVASASQAHAIPLLDWQQVCQLQPSVVLASSNMPIVPSVVVSQQAFALLSKPCMSPRFPMHTMLIFDPKEPIQDGDLVLVVYQDILEAAVKKIVLDGRSRYLVDINKRTEESICPKIHLHSVLVERRFLYKN
jgi:SOS-response transcriptional repressor LexA